jgi:putative ABC transport system ATP-binding protein
MAILQLAEIRKIYTKGDNEVIALGGVNLEIEKGEFCAIVGPSGSGKTTLLNIIGCLDVPTSGTMRYAGQELRLMGEKELSSYRREHVSFIFQSYNLIPVLTVAENVELPLTIGNKSSPKQIRKRVLQILDAVGIADKANRFPRELSGGQEQRVAIARALVKNPSVVLADEPTANLDSHNAEEIVRLMKRINKDMATTFVFSTHDKLIMGEARRVVELHDGLILKDERRES